MGGRIAPGRGGFMRSVEIGGRTLADGRFPLTA